MNTPQIFRSLSLAALILGASLVTAPVALASDSTSGTPAPSAAPPPAPPAPPAAPEDPVAKAAALRIVRQMRFFDIFKMGTESAINAASDTEMAPALKACFREYVSEERISPWLASAFTSYLTDPAQAAAISSFLDSAPGAKFVQYLHDVTRAGALGGAPVNSDTYFTVAEKSGITDFVQTPAGVVLQKMFEDFPAKSKQLQVDMTVDLVRYCGEKGALGN
jgi:hypothetical protein